MYNSSHFLYYTRPFRRIISQIGTVMWINNASISRHIKWNISSEYLSLNSKAFTDDLKQATKLLQGETIPGLYEARKILENIISYSRCELGVNQMNLEARGCISSAERLFERTNTVHQAILSKLSQMDKTMISLNCNDQIDSLPDFSMKDVQQYKNRYEPEDQSLINALKQDGHTAWTSLYDNISRNIRVSVGTKELGLTQISMNLSSEDRNIRMESWLALQEGWKIHELSAAASINAIAGWRIELARYRNMIYHSRMYDHNNSSSSRSNNTNNGSSTHETSFHYLDKALTTNRISKDELDIMMSIVDEANIIGRKALNLQAKLMNVKQLHPCDLLAPLPIPLSMSMSSISLPKPKPTELTNIPLSISDSTNVTSTSSTSLPPSLSSSSSTSTYTLADARRIIANAVHVIHPTASEFIHLAFDNQWIDLSIDNEDEDQNYHSLVIERDGDDNHVDSMQKTTPCASSSSSSSLSCSQRAPDPFVVIFPMSGTPRVFIPSFNGSIQSVCLLAHYLGHAFHLWVLGRLPYHLRHCPDTLAESAAVLFEMAVMDSLQNIDFDSDCDCDCDCDHSNPSVARRRRKGRRRSLSALSRGWADTENAILFLLDIPSRYSFEIAVYEEKLKGSTSLSAMQLKVLMAEAWSNRFGEGMVPPDELVWAHKKKFHLTKTEFYNYLFALSIYSHMHQNNAAGNGMDLDIIAFLQDTGYMSAEELVSKHFQEISMNRHINNDINRLESDEAVVNTTRKPFLNREFWKQSVQVINSRLDAFELVVNEINKN